MKKMKKPYLLGGLVCSLVAVIIVCASLVERMQTVPLAPPAKTPTVIIQKLFGGIPLGVSAKSTVSLPACLSNPTPTPPYSPRCYSPQQIRKAYDVNGLLNAGITGKGQTIVIIDETSSPTLQSDLHQYDQIFGLPDPPTLNVIAPFGMPPQDGAYVETALDVQAAHSLAPAATIDLVLTGDTSKEPTQESFFYNLLKPVKYAVDHNLGSSISISYAGGESCFDTTFLQYEHSIFQEARDTGISVFVSSGDNGAAVSPSCTSPAMMSSNPLRVKGVNILAADPLVTSVGGTTLNAEVGSGTYIGETAWNDTYSHILGTGGGFSSDFPRPGYQQGVHGIGAMRGLPDVSWDGDTFTGVAKLMSPKAGIPPDIGSDGGTSLGAPSWAGLSALFDQYAGKRLGFLNDAFYRILKSQSYHQGFRDITAGNNSVTGSDANQHAFSVTGYNAGPGWDATTGIGTPKVSALAALLKQYVYPGDGRGR